METKLQSYLRYLEDEFLRGCRQMGKIFKERTAVETARKLFLEQIVPLKLTEMVRLEASVDRVLARAVYAERNVPHYRRSAMDGYALRASNTQGASPANPILLELSDKVQEGSCVWVHTGAPVPAEANAVLMLEDTQKVGALIEVRAQVHPNRNIGAVGEDIKIGDLIFEKGHQIRPCDASVLASLGFEKIEVFQKPLVAVIPTGDELLNRKKIQEIPPPGRVLETNGLMASLYVEKWGGISRSSEIVPDNQQQLKEAVKANLDADMILISGGTSVGKRDHAPEVLENLGKILVRGIGAVPGKPTTLGLINKVPIVCLPGYPVAGLVALYFFVRAGLWKLAGKEKKLRLENSKPSLKRLLSAKVSSRIGYVSFVRVVLEGEYARPLMGGGAGVLSSVAKADGFLLVPENVEGYEAGAEVEIFLLE